MKKKQSVFVKSFIAASLGMALAGGVSAADDIDPALTAQLCQAPPQQYQHIDTAPFESRTTQAFYQNDFGGRQFLLYGDTDHYDLRIHEAFYKKEHIDYLASIGVKHIFIERDPHVSQQGIDDLVSGAITPEEFARDYAGGGMWERKGSEQERIDMAEGVIYAASKGIAVHASDVKTKGIATKQEREELYKFYGDMSSEFNRLCPGADTMTGAFYQYYMIKNQAYLQENNRGRRFGEIMQERYNDANRVALIKSIAGNERSAIFYGAAHLHGPRSIPALLGAGSTVHINIFPDSTALDEYGLDAAEGIDFAYVVDQDRF